MNPMALKASVDETGFRRWMEGARRIEQDRFGPKVYALPGERMLKLFRVKRFLSSNLWSPYAWRFSRNSLILKEREIPTVTCLQWGYLAHLDRQYVLYEKLAGTPLRELEDLDPVLLGCFFACLHDRGIYFRSCHLGNLLLLEEGGLGLIDILDIRFRRRPLNDGERERSFRHLRRLPPDQDRLKSVWKPFLQAYERG